MEQSHSKFFEEVYALRTGRPVDAARGLEDRMSAKQDFLLLASRGAEGIQDEVDRFVSSSDDAEARQVGELLRYIRFETASEREYPNGVRDKGRGPVDLRYFVEHPKAREAHLNEEEVVALRLYTTAAYKFMNNPLRDEARYARGESCPLPVTTYIAVRGIKKLRALQVNSDGAVTLWRGMRNVEVAESFMREGGTELAFMSTTTELGVAARYSLSRHSVLFKIVSPGFMTTGAEIQWLSAFPAESEILYPPLTYLKPTGRTENFSVEGNGGRFAFSVVEAHPQLA